MQPEQDFSQELDRGALVSCAAELSRQARKGVRGRQREADAIRTAVGTTVANPENEGTGKSGARRGGERPTAQHWAGRDAAARGWVGSDEVAAVTGAAAGAGADTDTDVVSGIGRETGGAPSRASETPNNSATLGVRARQPAALARPQVGSSQLVTQPVLRMQRPGRSATKEH